MFPLPANGERGKVEGGLEGKRVLTPFLDWKEKES
jgi:hypothetical protein